MTNEELKKKIVKVLQELRMSKPIVPNDYGLQIISCTTDREIAEALIAAGIGDLKEHRIFAGKDGSIKQLYSDEEVEDIARQRDEYKHRAAMAERALENACVVILSSRNGDQPRRLRAYYKAYLEAAEKELAEENNGKKEV